AAPAHGATEALLPHSPSISDASSRARRLKSRQERHEVRLRGLMAQSGAPRAAWSAGFVPFLPRFQPTALRASHAITRDDLVYLNAASTGGTRRRRPNRPADLRIAEAHAGTPPPVREDFVTVPFPRIAAGGPTADRAAAEAA